MLGHMDQYKHVVIHKKECSWYIATFKGIYDKKRERSYSTYTIDL